MMGSARHRPHTFLEPFGFDFLRSDEEGKKERSSNRNNRSRSRNKHHQYLARPLNPSKLKKMAKKFDKLLERATAPTLLEPDWEGILNCVDAIRSGEAPAKQAVASMKKRFQSENPHVSLYALMVLEASVKNCGEKVYKEIASKDFMEDLKHLAMESGEKVKEKVLELVQCWAHAFRNKQEYKIVSDTHNLMKLEGFEFPAMRESDAMFSAESAPDWVDADSCFRCRASFGVLTRKHHCRACGQIFCDKCSNKNLILPHIGIEKEVRVCESCYDKFKAKSLSVGRKKDKKDSKDEASSSPKNASPDLSSSAGKTPSSVKEKEMKEREEEELAIAMALSQSEADEKERQRQRQLMQLYNGPDSNDASAEEFYQNRKEPTTTIGYRGVMDSSNGVDQSPEKKPPTLASQANANTSSLDSSDPELARYLNRAYWETRRTEQKHGILRQSPTPSAPPPSESGSVNNEQPVSNGVIMGKTQTEQITAVAAPPPPDSSAVQNGLPGDDDASRFASALKSQVEVFVNRIRSNQGRGRSIVNDSSIQTLFLSLTNLHSDLLNKMHNLDEKRSYFESLQDRLSSIEEARQAVEALREEHEKRRQAELLEAQRLRQIQMQQKLEVMRHKKHEMLEHQRLMALQRMQQQEQEIQMRRQMAAMALAGQTLPTQQQIGVQPGAIPPSQQQQIQATGYGVQQWPAPHQQTQPLPQQIQYDQQGFAQPQSLGYNPQQIQGYPSVQQGYFPATHQPQPETAAYAPQQIGAAQPTYMYQQPLAQPGYAPQMMAPPPQQELPVQQQQIYQPPPQTQVQQTQEQKQEDLLISFD